MPSVCFYFQVHQPRRLNRYRIFDIGERRDYFSGTGENNLNNEHILKKVAHKSYLPANALLLEMLDTHPELRVSFSLSGILLEQLVEYAPEVLDSFRRLVDTGQVELLGETYYHSLSFFYSREEFERQVRYHALALKNLFGQTPKVFRNTELSYTNALGEWAAAAGYSGIITEGWDALLRGRSPNFLYEPPNARGVKILLKNYRLSDDVAFRFSEKNWSEWPLDASKFANWVSAINGNGQSVNLFMDYETFGEHQWDSTGIFHFLRALPDEILKHPDNNFKTPSEIVNMYDSVDMLDVPGVVTWADTERDLSAWTGNAMQRSTLEELYALEKSILACGDSALIEDWRRLQTSDHFYYMCTKWFSDGDVHKYFNPYDSPYDAYITFRNVMHDVQLRVRERHAFPAHTLPVSEVSNNS